MYTTRGYRQHSKENRKKSEYGQIIQKKPTFQIDNNPVVLDAYKKFILSTMPRMLRTQLYTETHEIASSDFNLSWTSSNTLPSIQQQLIAFAAEVFNRYEALGKYPISLELYAPDLDDSFEWIQVGPASYPMVDARFIRIIIDIKGNLSWIQQPGGPSEFKSFGAGDISISDIKLGYNISNITYNNPSVMKVDVNYLTFYNGN